VARATRYLAGILIVVAAIAGWRAATRWLTDGATLADRLDPERSEPPVLPDGTAKVARTADVAWDAEAAKPRSSIAHDAPDPILAPAPDVPAKPARTGARWTAEDDAYLAAHGDEDPDTVAHHLGRTPNAVSLRRATLNREGR
jgi:hypothetical protein